MYRVLIRPVLFLFDPETIHHLTFKLLSLAGKIPGVRAILRLSFSYNDNRLERTIFGLQFPNPIGLAAGFDKDAKLIDELACFGFGFIEIGTLTPKGQPGNDTPRLFRLAEDQAVINRMGFNNEGVLAAVERLRKRELAGGAKVIIGGNIGKNKMTSNENAFEDYQFCFEALYPHVDYFVVNVSSPNTPHLRELQEKEPLKKLMSQIKALSLAKEKPKPVLLKIAPDLNENQLTDIVEILLETKTDGVIATNTTVSREGLITSKDEVEKIGAGGLSGKPLAIRSNEVISFLRIKLGANYPIIGVGGILSGEDAIEKMKAGADLIQIYTGFIYEGPGLVNAISKRMLKM